MGAETFRMTTVTISLPQDVKELAEAEAARAGHSLDEYVARLILSQADRPIGAETEAELLKGLRSPGRELSPADFEARKHTLATRSLLEAGKDVVLFIADDFDAPLDGFGG
jgi:hypothetical protein